jgi:hypothetical protein
MNIIIRVNDKISPTCVKWVTNKQEMVDKCLNSLIEKVTDQQIYFLVDQMDGSKFKKYGEVYEIDKGNKRETIDAMLDLGHNTAWETCLFLEDDYLWREGKSLKELENAILNFGAVTPYDHPDHYFHPTRRFHRLEPYYNRLYRNCITTTHTFGVRRDSFINHYPDFHYGDHDWQMWTKLDAVGVPIWSPIVSMATHLSEGHLALGYDWGKRYAAI